MVSGAGAAPRGMKRPAEDAAWGESNGGQIYPQKVARINPAGGLAPMGNKGCMGGMASKGGLTGMAGKGCKGGMCGKAGMWGKGAMGGGMWGKGGMGSGMGMGGMG